jgi:eukaryotic-like serine/threonine-protein kinase
MGEASDHNAADGRLERLDPVTMAEALLLTLDRGQLSAIEAVPIEGGVRVRGERAGHEVVLGDLSSELGEALTARLALLAGLDLAGADEQLGRIRTSTPNRAVSVEHLVAMRDTGSGRLVEVRALVGAAMTPSAHPKDAAASRSLGTYTLHEEIGRGGMGVIYRGEHLTLQKPVAIKVLHRGMAEGAETATRLIMEARAACRARHPAIVDVSDIGRLPDGRTFLVMELVEAPTLDVLLGHGPLPVERVLRIAGQVASALAAACEAGVVHHDIKPGNLFVLPGDRVKVTDFGVARMRIELADTSSAEGVSGTAWYMSPEQASAGPTDSRSDLYSLGVVMFEMLTGRVPFDGERLVDILNAHMTMPVSSLVGPTGLVAPPVEAIVRRALEKNPNDRYASPTEMMRAIEQAARMLEEETNR